MMPGLSSSHNCAATAQSARIILIIAHFFAFGKQNRMDFSKARTFSPFAVDISPRIHYNKSEKGLEAAMNFFRKFYCRTVHVALRCAVPLMPYRPPKVLSSQETFAAELQKSGVKKVLLVTGKTVQRHGLLLPVTDALDALHIGYEIFDETTSDPTMSEVEAAFSRYRAENCNGVIAVGGGSPMDCAKSVVAKILRPKKSLLQLAGVMKVRGRAPFFAAVPTTAGTGSEASVAAVVTDEEAQRKFTILSYSLVPQCTLLLPALTASLPPAPTAETGMDALTHAVEAYIGRAATRETRQCAVRAITLIFDNLIAAVHNGEDLVARENLQRAAYEEGVAFTQSFVGYVHAAAHALGGLYHLPHGRLCAALLPLVLRMYGKSCRRKLAELARACDLCGDVSDMVAAETFIHQIELLNCALGIPETIAVREEDIPELARRADREANPLYPVPRLMDRGELQEIFVNIRQAPMPFEDL